MSLIKLNIVAIDATWWDPDPSGFSFSEDFTLAADKLMPTPTWVKLVVNNIPQMVFQVCSVANNTGMKISNLTIKGHGRPGIQHVGGGLNPGKNQFLQASDYPGVRGRFAGYGELDHRTELHLMPLRGRFASDGIVSLGGCQTGDGPSGTRLLKRLSFILGVKVEAGICNQAAAPGYEGPVKRCDANTCSIMKAEWLY